MYKIVDNITVTIPTNSHETIFQIHLSHLGLNQIRHYHFFGMEFQKPIEVFINELSEKLSAEICDLLLGFKH